MSSVNEKVVANQSDSSDDEEAQFEMSNVTHMLISVDQLRRFWANYKKKKPDPVDDYDDNGIIQPQFSPVSICLSGYFEAVVRGDLSPTTLKKVDRVQYIKCEVGFCGDELTIKTQHLYAPFHLVMEFA